MSKDNWWRDYEHVSEDFAADRIDREEAERVMKALGFDPPEIAAHLDAIEADKS